MPRFHLTPDPGAVRATLISTVTAWWEPETWRRCWGVGELSENDVSHRKSSLHTARRCTTVVVTLLPV